MKVNALEKITINANTSDLGKIDLLISEGFYTTRTEFIKTGMKLLLDKHEDDTKRLIHTKSNDNWVIGVSVITKQELENLKSKRKTTSILCMGLLVIDKDISLELIQETIKTIKVYGVCRCSQQIKQYYSL